MSGPVITWRGSFGSAEVERLHADAFGEPLRVDVDHRGTVERHSLGWVTARAEDDELIGFVNVLWDGDQHAWLQDVMIATSAQRHGVGRRLVARATEGARAASCAWLHVDFEDHLGPFYLDACGFTPTRAGVLRLTGTL